ncbi:hypothetical protein [Tepidiforma sp.]|uniref:hypothetical protein n=1 Tax=Tepidiforma sp. TaxID=2682230 RepID=UPI002ADDC309|nr:hypothetical protein [Tepidiforma sp.]
MSAEELLFYLGAAAYFLPPAAILALVARSRRRSLGFAGFALLGWAGLIIGLVVLLTLPPGRPPGRPLS